MDNADMPAMPCDILTPDILLSNGGADIPAVIEYHGLTKRELFAGLAMQGMLSDPSTGGDAEMLAVDAVNMADALLKELDK